jgi:methionyl-tRNA synthetase
MSQRRTLYHTTPIYYLNDVPHVGHAYTTLAADALARARRLMGHDVYWLTGTDEHGQNIERIARERGVTEQEHCDRLAAHFRELWGRYGFAFDDFIRTTEERHRRGVLRLWERLRGARTPLGREAVYEGTYAGWYCPRCEGFKTEDELKPGQVCPDHERPCEWTEEQNYFFRLSDFGPWLREKIEASGDDPERIRIDPVARRNEVLAVIRDGLQDFSISRARVKWGIAVPEQPDHVFYVWMDALANYVTALGFAEDGRGRARYDTYWERADERLHLVGKEIIRFHCLYWPAMLKAAGVPVPTRVYAHGHLTKNGKKLSKTTGNVIDPVALLEQYGPDAVRYFFLREGSFGQDWDYTDSAFVTRYNADLANDLGNLVSRALTMVQRYCDGRVPARPELAPPGAVGLEELFQLDQAGEQTRARALERYEQIDFGGALALAWGYITQLNQRIVQVEPWTLAKDPARRGELDAFLYRLIEAVRLIAVLVSPVMPVAAGRIFMMLGCPADPTPADLAWGCLEPGAALGTVEPLFPRLDTAAPSPAPAPRGPATAAAQQKKEKPVSETQQPAPTPAPVAEAAAPVQIDIDEFARLDLRVGRVLAAEAVPKSKKLLKLQIDLGEPEPRQVVGGIADAYAPEALVGRSVVVVANLKPAKLMGVESRGMVLAASIDGRAELVAFEKPVAPGTKVR